HSRRGDRTAALDHLERALAVARELADQHLEAVTLNTVGLAHLEAGDTGAARSLFRQALALRGRVPDAYEEAHIRRNLADLEQRCGDPAGAGYHRALAVRLYRKANARDEADRLCARPAAPAPAL